MPGKKSNAMIRQEVKLDQTILREVRGVKSMLKPKTKKNKKKKGISSGKRSKSFSAGLMVHPIAQKLLVGLASPFDSEAIGCKNIGSGATPSQTWSGTARQIYTSIGGPMMLFLNPFQRQDAVAYGYTMNANALGAGEGKYYSVANQPNVAPFIHLMSRPYSHDALISTSSDTRIVSLGIRVKYSGNATSRGGRITFYEDTSLDGTRIYKDVIESGGFLADDEQEGTLTGQQLLTRIQGYRETRVCSFMENDVHEFHVHTIPQDSHISYGEKFGGATLNYTPYGKKLVASGPTELAKFGEGVHNPLPLPDYMATDIFPLPRAVMFITPPPTGGSSFSVDIEYILHTEYYGGTLTSFHTPSPTHIEDDTVVRHAIVRSKQNHALEPNKHPFAHVMDELQRTVKAKTAAKVVMGSAIAAAKPSAKAMLMSGMSSLLL